MSKLLTPLLFAVLFCVSHISFATEQSRAENIAVVVADQIDAFGADDGERAFSHASPTIQAYFRNPDVFMRMVKRSYDMVYRPKAHEIEDIVEIGNKIFQPVLFTDQENQLFKVMYEMQQQEDESWKINGVSVLKPKGLAI